MSIRFNVGTRRRAQRVGLGVVDQLLYSASNFVLTILVARSTTVAEFGAFALVAVAYLVCNAIARGLTSETLVIRFSAVDSSVWRTAAESALSASVGLGFVMGAAFVSVGVIFSGTFAELMVVFGLMVPGLLVQDYLRFASLSHGRPGWSLVNDAVQVGGQFIAAGVLLGIDRASALTLVAAWGGSAYLAAGVALAFHRLRLKPRGVLVWFRENGDLAGRYALDDLGGQIGQNGATFLVGALTGLAGPAALRGAQTVFGPPSVVTMGVQAAALPELVRILHRSSSRMTRFAAVIGAVMATAGLVWGIIALSLSSSAGRFLFGASWDEVRPLLVFFLANQVAGGFRLTPIIGLRALGAANRTLISRIIIIGVGVSTQTVGAFLDGARGVAIASAIAGPIQVGGCWWQYRRALSEYRDQAEERRPSSEADSFLDTTTVVMESWEGDGIVT